MITQPIHRPGRPRPALSRRALLAGGALGGAGLLLGLSLQTGGEVLEQRRVGRPGRSGNGGADSEVRQQNPQRRRRSI